MKGIARTFLLVCIVQSAFCKKESHAGAVSEFLQNEHFERIYRDIQPLWQVVSDYVYDTDHSPIIEEQITPTMFKRQVPPPSERNYEGIPCSYVGREKFRMLSTNLCVGTSCHPLEANCNGTILQFSPHVNNTIIPPYNGSIATECTITKLRCMSPYGRGGLFYDLEEQFGAKECKVEYLLCQYNDREFILTPEFITNALLVQTDACHVQISCEEHAVYGFQAFGFKCHDDHVICNGTEIDFDSTDNIEDVYDMLETCSVDQMSCGLYWTRAFCRHYEILCTGQEINGCEYGKIPVKCPDYNPKNIFSQTPSCQVIEIECEGKTMDVERLNQVDLTSCVPIRVQCNSSVITREQMGSNCHLSQIRCLSGSFMPTISHNFTGNLSECIVDKIHCQDEFDSCRLNQFTCENLSHECVLNGYRFNCANEDACLAQQNTSTCICPIDRTRGDCGELKTIQCSLDRISPDCRHSNLIESLYPHPSPFRKHLDADWPCLIYSLEEEVTLQYQLECAFENPENASQEVIDANFTYFASTPHWGISEPTNWTVLFKLFNFRLLSDNEATHIIQLTRQQMEGTHSIDYHSPLLSEIPDKFWTGNRIYMEIGWDSQESPSYGRPSNRILRKEFIDSFDRIEHQRGPLILKGVKWYIIAIPSVIVGILIVVGAIVAYRRFTRSKRYEPLPQNESSAD